MRSEAAPHLIVDGGSAEPLERIKLGGTEIRETLLQDLLDGNPGILPVSNFDESFGPIVSLGREIMGIDNLFISPTGRLTLVEAKLWRNPQAVREVLAQVVDYASRLSKLTYEDFEERCRASRQTSITNGFGLFDLICREFPDHNIQQTEFVNGVTRNLRNGRFLLLVVGDGIREGLARMLDALHHQSRLHFTFGLVELQLFRLPEESGLLAVPSIVAHSTEIERAVVTIRGAESSDVQVEVRSDPQKKAPRLTETEFLQSMESHEARQFAERVFEWARENASIDIIPRSAAIRLPFSTTRKGLILMRIFPSGRVLVTPPKLKGTLRNAGVEEDLVMEIAMRLKELYPEIELQPDKNSVAAAMRAEDLLPNSDKVLEIYQLAADRARELDPNASAMEETKEDDDGE